MKDGLEDAQLKQSMGLCAEKSVKRDGKKSYTSINRIRACREECVKHERVKVSPARRATSTPSRATKEWLRLGTEAYSTMRSHSNVF